MSQDDPRSRRSMLRALRGLPRALWKAMRPRGPTTTKSAFRKVNERICRDQARPSRAGIDASAAGRCRREIACHKRPAQRNWLREKAHMWPAVRQSRSFACGSPKISGSNRCHQIGKRIGRYRDYGNDQRKPDEQRYIASQCCAPGELTNARRISNNFNRNGSAKSDADADSSERNQRSRNVRQYVPQKDACTAQSTRFGRDYVRHLVSSHEQIPQIPEYVGKDNQSNRQLHRQAAHQEKQGQYGGRDTTKKAAQESAERRIHG